MRKNYGLWDLLLAAFAVFYLILRYYLIRDRMFNPDELYHLHSAFCTANGMLIFRDFFEFHGPLLPWLSAPLVKWFSDPIVVLFAARAAMTVPWALCLIALWFSADRLVGRRAATLTLVLVSSFSTFALKSFEFRPDVPAAALFFIALAISRRERHWTRLALMGCLLGTAFFFTPKVVYPSAGMIGTLLWEEYCKQRSLARLIKTSLVPLTLGGVFPLLCLVGIYGYAGALGDFIQNYFLFNRTFPRMFGPQHFLVPSLLQNKAVWVLGLCGLMVFWRNAPLVAMTLITLAGLFHLVLPYEQYYLLLGPLLCMLAAAVLIHVWDKYADLPGAPFYACGVLGILLVKPISSQIESMKLRNSDQLNEIRCVSRFIAPNERVFDVWSGTSFARPHAFKYWALPRDLRQRFDPAWLASAVSQALQDPKTRGLVWDRNFDELPETVQSVARQSYRPTGCCDLWIHVEPAPSSGHSVEGSRTGASGPGPRYGAE